MLIIELLQKEVITFVPSKTNPMKKEMRFTVFLVSFLLALQVNAQSTRLKIKSQNDLSPWSIGIGTNLVEDNGRGNNVLFVNNGKLNMVPFPSVLHGSRVIYPFLSAHANLSYNNYQLTIRENNLISYKKTTYFSLDINGHFSLPMLNKTTDDWFNPFVATGFGFNYRSSRISTFGVNYNIGFGAESLITKNWSVQLSAMAKFGLEDPLFKSSANHLQAMLLVKYRFNNQNKSDFSRKRYPELKKKRKFKKEA